MKPKRLFTEPNPTRNIANIETRCQEILGDCKKLFACFTTDSEIVEEYKKYEQLFQEYGRIGHQARPLTKSKNFTSLGIPVNFGAVELKERYHEAVKSLGALIRRKIQGLNLAHGIPEIADVTTTFWQVAKKKTVDLNFLEFNVQDLSPEPKMGYNFIDIIHKLEQFILDVEKQKSF